MVSRRTSFCSKRRLERDNYGHRENEFEVILEPGKTAIMKSTFRALRSCLDREVHAGSGPDRMTETWHRSEPRLVRPFFNTKNAEDAVANSLVRLRSGVEPSDAEVYDLDEIDLPQLAPSLLPRVVPLSQWLPADHEPDDFEIVLLARSQFLKTSLVVARFFGSSTIPGEVPVQAQDLQALGGGRNLQLTVAICLSKDKPPKPGSPFSTGHWVASKHFWLRERTIKSLFDVRPRTSEEWVENGYPARTLYCIDYDGGIDSTDPQPKGIAAYMRTPSPKWRPTGSAV